MNKWIFKQSVQVNEKASLSKLLGFYLLESPVPNTSNKGKTLKELGWKGSNLLTLQSQLRSTSTLTQDRWIDCYQKEIEDTLRTIKRFESFDCSFEFAVHTIKSGLNKTEALFYLIRNGFAHGGFRICKFNNEMFYVFETKQKDKLKGRAILKEKTLLKWAKLIKNGPSVK